MVSIISNFFDCAKSHPFLTVGAIVVGLASYPLVKRVSKVAINVIKTFSSWLWNNTFAVRIRSLFCHQCALQHKFHSELKKKINDTASENLIKDKLIIQVERD